MIQGKRDEEIVQKSVEKEAQGEAMEQIQEQVLDSGLSVREPPPCKKQRQAWINIAFVLVLFMIATR